MLDKNPEGKRSLGKLGVDEEINRSIRLHLE
jgi:hypothetical protein